MRTSALSGRTILITRPRERADELAALIRARGAVPIEAPTIEVRPPRARDQEKLLAQILGAARGRFSWVVFTSAEAVEAWFRHAPVLLVREDPRPRSLVAAVGSATAGALRDHGVEPDLIPRSFTTGALARSFPQGSGEVLIPRADIASTDLQKALRAKGWTPVRATAYRTRIPRTLPSAARRVLHEGLVDAVVFTSASSVHGFLRLAGVITGPKVVCIGPVTARAARSAGFKVHAVARPHTVGGLVAALERALAGDRPSPRPRSATR